MKEGIRNMVNAIKEIRDLLLGKQSHKTPNNLFYRFRLRTIDKTRKNIEINIQLIFHSVNSILF
jgi:hypothetical protein